MRKWSLRALRLTYIGLVLFLPAAAIATNYTMTQGSGTTFGSLVVSAVNYAQQLLCDPTTPTQCAAVSAGGAVKVDGSAATQPVSQATSSNLKSQVDPLTAASWGIGTSTQNSTSVTNGHMVLGQFNTSPATITSTNMSPIQLDSTGNLKVNVVAGGAGGGAVTVASGADVAEGSIGDAAWTSGNGTTIGILKAIAGSAAASLPTGGNRVGYTSDDACAQKAKTTLPINQNGTSSVQLIALSGSTTIYVCSLFLMTNSTGTTVALTTGTGSACVTSNAAVIGSTTANIANSINLITGAGFTHGNGGGTIGQGAAGGELCMILGSNVFVSGVLSYVQQ